MSTPDSFPSTAAAQSGEVLVTCDCGQSMRAPATVMGTVGRCTSCGQTFVATDANTQPAPPRSIDAQREDSTLAPKPPARIRAMDQLRGYAIFGMIVVNFLGGLPSMPQVIEHHRDTYSYADTIAPLFLFVVGMGFRLSIKKRAERGGLGDARWHALKRYLVLLVVALAFYGPDYMKDWWDALTEIALAGILTLPFIDKSPRTRIIASFFYLGAFALIFFGTGYGTWLEDKSMNGGPLGAIGASFILLWGTVAYDLLASRDQQAIVRWSLLAGVGLCAAALVVWYLVPKDFTGYGEYGPYWPFAKRWAAAPFTLLSTGIAFLTFLFFYLTSELAGFNFPGLSILGENPLVIYLVQYSLLEMNGNYLSESLIERADGTGTVIALGAFLVFYGFVYAVARRLHRDRIIIKL